MCGLVGIAANNISAPERKMFNTMLFLDEIRGPHSTGVATMDKAGTVNTYKRALKASDYMQLNGHTSNMLNGDRVIIGHNRYATVGSKDDNNAHPFTHGGITLAHNGTLTHKTTINSDDRSFGTDSETVAYAFSKEPAKDVIERLQGAYALTWIDEDMGTINLARNDERPLFVGRLVDGIVWSSEKAILELAAAHNKIKVESIEELPVGSWRAWEIGKMTEGFYEEEFTPKKPTTTTRHGGTNRTNTTLPSGGTHESLTKAGLNFVGKSVTIWNVSVSDSGWTMGYTDEEYLPVSLHLPADKRIKAKQLDDDCIIRGTIHHYHIQYTAGEPKLRLSMRADGVEVLDFDDWG